VEDAAAWRIDALDIDFVEYVRKDDSFDSSDVLPSIVFKHMCEAGCFAKLDTLSILTSNVKHPSFLPSPGHMLDQNYSGPFLKLAQAYEQERVKFNPGILSPKEYLADRLQSAIAEICSWVRDGRLRASGTPVEDGREIRAREIRPSEMSAAMTIGADGLLYQGQIKNSPAWKAIYVSWSDFMQCRGEIASSSTTKHARSVTMMAPKEILASPDPGENEAKPNGGRSEITSVDGKPVPTSKHRGGRKPTFVDVHWQILESKAHELLDEHGGLSEDDPTFNSKEKLIEELQICADKHPKFKEVGGAPGRESIRKRIDPWVRTWETKRTATK